MKRKLIIIILVIIISECAAFLTIIAFLINTSKIDKIDTFTEEKLRSKAIFNIKAEVEIDGNIVNVKEDLVFDVGSKQIHAYVPSVNKARTEIIKVSSDGAIAKSTLKDTNLQITLNEPNENIHIEYRITLEKASGTMSYSGSMVCLTNFLITPSVKKNKQVIDSYSMSFGDPYIYGMNKYYVLFKIKKDLNVSAPGSKEEYLFGANKVTIFEALDLRDFPVVLYTSADVYEEKKGGTNFIYINSKETKENVKTAFDFATKNIGPYPYDYFFIVKTPLEQSGMEFSNMIFISDKCFNNREDLKRVTYHEVFHQWFYGIIGTDQLNEPFLDEGLVNYLAMNLCGDNFPDTYYNGFLNLTLKDYSSREEYYSKAYNNSANYFHMVNKKLGNNFYKLLKKLYNEKKYDITTFDDFNKYANEFSGGK